jgi:hypothetical protein
MFITTPLTTRELRDILERLIGTDLGVFKNGIPAIWVEEPAAPETGQGLHCLIYYRPRQLQKPIGLTQSLQVLAWQVTLIQVDRSVTGIETLSRVGDKIRNSFSGCTEGASNAVADRLPVLNYSIPFSKTENPHQLI